jgi:mono/diheme cytochrome c family protein
LTRARIARRASAATADLAATAGAGLAPLIAGLALSAACGGAGGPGAPPEDSATLLRSDLERAGERVYRQERCDRCHTLRDAPPPAGTPAALPGGPPPGGWRGRIGPDLGLEGHRRSDDWHLAHLYAPAVVVRGSRMPASRHLFRPAAPRPEPTADARALVAYLQALGRARRDIWAEWRRAEPEVPAAPPVTGSLRERGRVLYADYCAACHGSDGGGQGAAAGLLDLPPRDLAAGRYRFKSTPGAEPPRDADLYRRITLGGGTGSAMPGFHFLPPADRWALVLRLREFSGALRGRPFGEGGGHAGGRSAAPDPGPPAGAARGGAAARGARIWGALGCAACHGGGGEGSSRAAGGAGETGGFRARPGDLRHACDHRGGASRAALARAVRHGLGEAMPAYDGALPGDGALDDLLAHLESLGADGAAP